MLWRTSPIGTELESVVVGWLREALGLPDAFDGLLTDTASTSSLIALAAARAGRRDRRRGGGARRATGRARAPRLRLRGGPLLDRQGVHDARPGPGVPRPDPDERPYEMRPDALEAAIAADRAAGPPADRRSSRPSARRRPPRSTRSPPSPTSPRARGSGSTSTPPTPGAVALLPGLRAPFAGWERADSIVVNPHKWLFTPLDASLLLSRRLDVVRDAFSLVPEYLRTLDRGDGPCELQRVHAPARPPLPGAEAVDPAPLVRPRRAAAADPPPPGAGRRSSRAGSMPTPDWERLAPGAVLDRLLPARPAGPRRRRRAALDAHNARGDGRGQPDRRGLPVPHEAARPVHDPPGGRQPADGAPPRRAGLGAAAAGRRRRSATTMSDDDRSRSCTSTGRAGAPTTSSSALFRKNHWPILREQLAEGRFTAVELSTPRFHGDGRADWDVLVSITYRDWAAMEAHSEAEIAAAALPGPGDATSARSSAGSSCSRRTGTCRWSAARWSSRAPGGARRVRRALGRRPMPRMASSGRRRPAEDHSPVPPIRELTRIEHVHLDRLEQQGIFTTGLLLEVSETPTRRQTLADQVEATTNDVLTWRDEALMLNLASFGPGRSPAPHPVRHRRPARHPRPRPRRRSGRASGAGPTS